jgi:hypothetical protein
MPPRSESAGQVSGLEACWGLKWLELLMACQGISASRPSRSCSRGPRARVLVLAAPRQKAAEIAVALPSMNLPQAGGSCAGHGPGRHRNRFDLRRAPRGAAICASPLAELQGRTQSKFTCLREPSRPSDASSLLTE